MGVSGKHRITSTPPSTSLRPSVAEIAARHEIEPLRQGTTDLLCGIYSPLNAIGLALHGIAPLGRADSKKLFETAAELLHNKRGGPEALYAGMGTRRWRQIARCMAERASSSAIAVEVERPDFDAIPTIDHILTWLRVSVEAGRPVLLRIVGRGLDHFTVAAGITPTKILLHDSAGLRWVRRASCEEPNSLYRIPPKSLLRIAVRRRE